MKHTAEPKTNDHLSSSPPPTAAECIYRLPMMTPLIGGEGGDHLSVIHLAYILPSTRSSSVKSPPTPSPPARREKKREGYQNEFMAAPAPRVMDPSTLGREKIVCLPPILRGNNGNRVDAGVDEYLNSLPPPPPYHSEVGFLRKRNLSGDLFSTTVAVWAGTG
ncbi:hypothetical protein CDAR_387771 [Caerostris darwini]|uniref:Uncharacterized protein n=1 Tax=Caerostris darwini TaxID=1538125 RepID=A0AAV4SWW1_9ARAC|nr:hypothetical protein CDAR_387771 [Caerostris darwini]